MNNQNTLFYENQKKVRSLWIRGCVGLFICGVIMLLFHFIDRDSTSVFESFPCFGLSLVAFLGFLYIRLKYVKITEHELETISLLKKRVYKLETLKRYECKKSHAKGYYYFIMYFGDKLCVVSVLDREKFAKLLDTVIEKNKANSNVSESDV